MPEKTELKRLGAYLLVDERTWVHYREVAVVKARTFHDAQSQEPLRGSELILRLPNIGGDTAAPYVVWSLDPPEAIIRGLTAIHTAIEQNIGLERAVGMRKAQGGPS